MDGSKSGRNRFQCCAESTDEMWIYLNSAEEIELLTLDLVSCPRSLEIQDRKNQGPTDQPKEGERRVTIHVERCINSTKNIYIQLTSSYLRRVWPNGRASVSGAEGCGFESRHSRFVFVLAP